MYLSICQCEPSCVCKNGQTASSFGVAVIPSTAYCPPRREGGVEGRALESARGGARLDAFMSVPRPGPSSTIRKDFGPGDGRPRGQHLAKHLADSLVSSRVQPLDRINTG